LRTAATEGRFEREGWRIRKDGTRFWAHVIVDPIRDPAGRLLGFAKITRDLTERRRAEDEIRRSEEQFRLLVQGVTDYAIYLLDPQGRVTNWNAGAERIKGYRADEIVGQHFSKFYTEEDRAMGMPARSLATAIRDGRFEKEGWRVRKDGTRFWANVVIDVIRDEQGQVAGFAKVTRDVTERRNTQLALDQAREALFQAQKMEAIGQLTGGIAHDFNNLLMAILGSLELVRKRIPDDPKTRSLLENAIHGAQRGASLTQRMLAFARRQELRRQAVDLPSLVEGMRGLMDRSLGPSVSISAHFPPGLALAESDPIQLESALLNLVVNARDAMPNGGTITISGDEVSVAEDGSLPAGRYVRLIVADTGEGMDEEAAQRATEPFYTTKGVGKGTGLGLSMAMGLAQQSGGKLQLSSRKGDGTTVELWLPIAGIGTMRAEPEVAEFVGPSRPLRVLAVDDDDLVLRNTAAMLEDLGHATVQAGSAEQALEILRSGTAVDIVITDQAMPRMTGMQLVEKMRAEWPDLPVILATGFAELPEGVGEWLPRLAKPFTQGDLARGIASAHLSAVH
jgi:PAS domain S-box-containing protein